jgi:hypothetical protein
MIAKVDLSIKIRADLTALKILPVVFCNVFFHCIEKKYLKEQK